MRTESEHHTPGQVLAHRVREARKRRDWTQQQLADRLRELGFPTHRLTIAKIEKGGTRAENAPLREVLALAAALDVAPVHLLVPLEDEAMVAVTPELFSQARHVRAWIRGRNILRGGDLAQYLAEMPDSEQLALLDPRDNISQALGGPLPVDDNFREMRDALLSALSKEESNG